MFKATKSRPLFKRLIASLKHPALLLAALLVGVVIYGIYASHRDKQREEEGARAYAATSRTLDRTSGYSGTPADMKQFLDCWEDSAQKAVSTAQSSKQARDQAPSRVTQEDVLKLDLRLGISLPASYRNFLLSGGANLQTFSNLQDGGADFSHFYLDSSQVGYFRQSHPKDVELSAADIDGADTTKHAVYTNDQDTVQAFLPYLQHAIVVGQEWDGVFYLLNPKLTMKDGEWEAWYLDPHLPGAYRFPSFAHLLRYLHRRDLARSANDASPVFPFGLASSPHGVVCEAYLGARDI